MSVRGREVGPDRDYEKPGRRGGRCPRYARPLFALAAASGVLVWVFCMFAKDDIPLGVRTEAHHFPSFHASQLAVDGMQNSSAPAAHAEEPAEHTWVPQSMGISIRSSHEAEIHLTIDDEATWRNLSRAVSPAHPPPLLPVGTGRAGAGRPGGAAVLELWSASPRLSRLAEGLRARSASRQLALTLEQVVGPRVDSSAALLRQGVEELRRKGVELKLQGRTHLRKRRAELARRSAQVHNSSLALADAIASGEVQRSVILLVVAAFLTIATVIQALSAARGRLRQLVRLLTARVLLRSPAPNELVTRPYAGWMELAVRVSLDFLNEPANIMLLSIGSLQVLATWPKADPWRCKKVNLLVLLLNFAYTLVQEVLAQRLAARHDGAWNLMPCVRLGGHGTAAAEESRTLAKDLEIGNVVRLRYGDICPASGKLEYASHSYVLFNSLCETGEDCCTILAVGDAVPLGFVLALEGSEVHVCITETRSRTSELAGGGYDIVPSPHKSRRMERFPEHMNQALTQANLAALALLFAAAALVAALNYHRAPASDSTADQPESRATGLSRVEVSLVTHFFSAVVQLNTLIPSMRWVVLFFFYVFLLEAARPEVRVQNWRALRGLDCCRVLFSDKTGTLTEVGLSVARLRIAEGGGDTLTAEGDADLGWLALVLVACNDSRPRPRSPGAGPLAGRRPGTSPEEIAIAEHLEGALGLAIDSNPLRPAVAPGRTPGTVAVHEWDLVLREVASGREAARATVRARGDFVPALGCREASLVLPGQGGEWVVRQGGSDLMAELAGSGAREAALAAEDCDRALGWSVARLGADGRRVGAWRYLLRASFANPPRATSAPLVAYCRSAGLAVRVLTGDACVAAVHIAREIGVVPGPRIVASKGSVEPGRHVCLYRPGEAIGAFSLRLQADLEASPEGLCVVLPGRVVREQIEAANGADAWLAEERVNAVIYRTRSADKAFIVRRAEELGRARCDAHAPGFSVWKKCMPRRRQAEDSFCMMMGDAANDADAISLEGVVGVSLSHGAAPCKLGADFLVTVPGALVAVLTELQGRSLAGARWLLEDVCLLCGLVSSLTLCGVWAAGFEFLPRGFLYDDPFDARLMTLFSSGLYAPSACAAACHVGTAAAALALPAGDAPKVLRALVIGAAVGCTIGLLGPSDDVGRFGRWILSAVASASLLRHSSVILRCRRLQSAAGDSISEAAGVTASTRVARSLGESAVGRARAAMLLIYLLLVWTG